MISPVIAVAISNSASVNPWRLLRIERFIPCCARDNRIRRDRRSLIYQSLESRSGSLYQPQAKRRLQDYCRTVTQRNKWNRLGRLKSLADRDRKSTRLNSSH